MAFVTIAQITRELYMAIVMQAAPESGNNKAILQVFTTVDFMHHELEVD